MTIDLALALLSLGMSLRMYVLWQRAERGCTAVLRAYQASEQRAMAFARFGCKLEIQNFRLRAAAPKDLLEQIDAAEEAPTCH